MRKRAFSRLISTLVVLSWLTPAMAADQGKAQPAPAERRKEWSFREVGKIPVQSNGRVKPLDSYAREIVLFVTGSRSYKGWDPVDLIFSWVTVPEVWETRPFIQVSREDVRRQLGLTDEKRTRFTPRELYHDSYLAQYARTADSMARTGGKPAPRDQELRRVFDRLALFHNIVSGMAWPVIPMPDSQAWEPLRADPHAPRAADKKESHTAIRASFAEMLLAYRAGEHSAFDREAVLARNKIESEIQGWDNGARRLIQAEFAYNRMRPFFVAWTLYLAGGILWLLVIALGSSPRGTLRLKQIGMVITVLAGLFHGLGIALRCYIAGRPPVTNMYESIIWVSLGVLVFAFILYYRNRQPVLLAVACILSMLGLIAADAAPAIMDPGIHPLVPVLRSNYWLTIHVLTITLGYAAFALTLGLGNVTLFQYGRRNVRSSMSKIQSLNQLTYRAMQFGVVLLAAGTILGGIWADYSWGRFWGWDPKEVWALIALLGYLVILHSRYAGWMGQFGFAAWSVVSFLLVVMAWYGVNFVLGVGLHSYGFASGGQGWVALLSAFQLIYVLAITLKFKLPRSAPGSAPGNP